MVRLSPPPDKLQGTGIPLPLQRAVEALHARGPRPTGELLALALRRLAPDDRDDVLRELERILVWPAKTVRALGADRFARPPLRLVPEQRP